MLTGVDPEWVIAEIGAPGRGTFYTDLRQALRAFAFKGGYVSPLFFGRLPPPIRAVAGIRDGDPRWGHYVALSGGFVYDPDPAPGHERPERIRAFAARIASVGQRFVSYMPVIDTRRTDHSF